MIGSGQIIQNGVETFTPAIERVHEIGLEFVNYFVYIGLGIVGIRILREAVKYIMDYLKYKSEDTIGKERKKTRRMYNRDNRYISRKEQEYKRKN